MSNWKELCGFLETTKPVSHRVNGQEVQFWPVSIGMMFSLRTIAQPLARALTALFANTQSDNTITDRDFKDQGRETISEAAPLKTLQWRAEQKENAIKDVIKAFTEDDNRRLIADLLMDSMRDVFDRNDRQHWPPAKEFFDSIPATHAYDLIRGFLLANKDCLGPLAAGVQAKFEAVQRASDSPATEAGTPSDSKPSSPAAAAASR